MSKTLILGHIAKKKMAALICIKNTWHLFFRVNFLSYHDINNHFNDINFEFLDPKMTSFHTFKHWNDCTVNVFIIAIAYGGHIGFWFLPKMTLTTPGILKRNFSFFGCLLTTHQLTFLVWKSENLLNFNPYFCLILCFWRPFWNPKWSPNLNLVPLHSLTLKTWVKAHYLFNHVGSLPYNAK